MDRKTRFRALRYGNDAGMSKTKGESDVAADPNVAGSRDTGGIDDPRQPDQASTSGTTVTPEFVGRLAGDDAGYEGETGAERRKAGEGPDRLEGGSP
jgi:hypothetical protein